MPQSKYWNLAGQAVAIVVSILLAFLIQAWWVESQEERDVDELLEVFAAELAENMAEIEKEVSFRQAKSDAAWAILRLVSNDEMKEVDSQELDELINDLGWWGVTDFATGALDSLIEGGKLSWIESIKLRTEVASWPDELQRVNRRELQDYDSYQTKLLPFLLDHTNLPQISDAGDGKPGTGGIAHDYKLPEIEKKDHRSLLKDQKFIALVTVVIWDQEDALVAFNRFLSLGADLLLLVQDR